MLKKLTYSLFRIFNLLFAILPTLGLYRSTVQSDYNWGLLIIQGTGRSEDYKWLALFALLAWCSFLLERWYKRKWYYLFPILLFGTAFLVTLTGILSDGRMTFQGDAWGIFLDVGFIYLLLTLLPLICLFYWMISDLKEFQPRTLRFEPVKMMQLAGCILLGVIALILFSLGEGGVHSHWDRLAVALTILQALALTYVNESTDVRETKDPD